MVWAAIVIFVGLQLAVRLTPVDPVRAHIDPFEAADPDRKGAKILRLVPLPPEEALVRLVSEIATTPRTRLIAGATGEARLTYVTRTAFWGFPDVTTVAVRPHVDGAELALLGRARIGSYDWDVNEKRLSGWLAAAGL